MELLDRLLIFFEEYAAFIRFQFAERTVLSWILFFFPVVVFLELPYYGAPLIMMPLLRLLGYPRDDTPEQERFLAGNPSVSVVVAARNEEEVIASTIESLLSTEYANLEVVVVDDSSTDRTYEIARRYADRGLIKLVRNSATSGRSGRPVASNLGLHVANGDFILSVDADTSFDRDIIRRMIGPFYDPEVGVVAGNIKVRNADESVWTSLQAAEYLVGIGLWKRWTDILGTTLQASGACGAFRREALKDAGAWSPETAEDADISMKAHKLGWKVRFAPRAIAMTTAPATFSSLMRQRVRWERGALRLYYHKHGDALLFWRYKFGPAFELTLQYLLSVVLSVMYAVYIVLMIAFRFKLLTFILAACYVFYGLFSTVAVAVGVCFSERRRHEWWLIQYGVLFPFYRGLLRWARLYGIVMETLRLKYRDPYLPDTAYDHMEWW
ncbi:MAG: glycosyltransferase family 2 protein [Candidatus Eisenbacteria bacterium]|nr:glycosyltransferase family 2 protein [Candidatus Eisenbacteria bacterium]